MNHDLYIIAEIANAAQGVYEVNLDLIKASKSSGADAVKLQLYKYDELCIPSYPKYDIYVNTFYTEEQRSYFISFAKELGLDVWVDIFDRWGLQVAKNNLDKITAIKIPPTIMLDRDLVMDICRVGKPIALGVGGHDDKEILEAISLVKHHSIKTTLMYGFQAFPTPENEVSLARIQHLIKTHNLPVGFADHTDAHSEWAFSLPEYAYFCGATIIEKHISMDNKVGYDRYSSLEPIEFANMVRRLKQCQLIRGSINISSAQKEYLIHATRATTIYDVEQGDLVIAQDVKYRRTGDDTALLPGEVEFPWVALKDIPKDNAITPADVKRAKVGNVIVCRLNSKRLEKKALLPLGYTTVIGRCIKQCKASNSDMTILATSTNQEDAELELCAKDAGILFAAGSEDDVVDRILSVADQYDLDIIVRVTGDSPFISYELIDYLVDQHCTLKSDYSYYENVSLGTRPEVISVSALRRLVHLIDTSKYSEYLSLFFKNNRSYFNVNGIDAPKLWSGNYRLNIDYPEDYDLLQKIAAHVGTVTASLESILSYLKQHPELVEINTHIVPKYQDGDFAKMINEVTTIANKN